MQRLREGGVHPPPFARGEHDGRERSIRHRPILSYAPEARRRHKFEVNDIADLTDRRLAGDLFVTNGLPVLERYTAIECLSPDFDASWQAHGAIDSAVELLATWCGERAIPACTVEVVRLPRRTPLIFAEIAATDGAAHRATTLLYGHLDKQPALGPWDDGLGPFAPVYRGDRLYGRGTADDGYATFAAFSAIESLAERGVAHGRILVLIEGSEESGSPDLDAYLDHLAPRLGTPGLVICLDSGCVTYDRLWVTTSLRGTIAGTLRVDVLKNGVHSGQAGGIVPSSFRITRRLLSRIEDDATGDLLLEELKAEIPPHRRAEIAQVAENFGMDGAGVFPLVDGLELTGVTAAERIERGTWRPSLAVTAQAGMPDLEAGGNVLRPFTTLKLSIRIPPNVDAARAAAAITKALTSNPPEGAHVTFDAPHLAQGWDAPPLEAWLGEAVESASLRHFGERPNAIGLGGSIPFMDSLGHRYPETQFLATGVLGPESNAHGPNEFLHVPTAAAVTCCVADVLAAVR
jgi:acetylornithine deacetylase/succinyl-diaminopimelate desuccinylase-like protein